MADQSGGTSNVEMDMCIAIGYLDYRNPDRTMGDGNELEECTSCIALINYMFVPCCLIHVSWLQLMRVFMLACNLDQHSGTWFDCLATYCPSLSHHGKTAI